MTIEENMLYLLPKNWCWSKLNAVSSLITDGSHAPPPKQNSGIPMLSAQNIFNDKISFTDVRYISQQAFEKEYKRAPVEPNDVLLTIVGTIGRSTVVQPNSQRFALQRSVALIKPKLNAKYLSLFLQSPIISTYLTNKARGTAQKGIYLNQLKEIPIAIAPTNEQNRIVFKVEELFSFLDAGVSSLRKVQGQLKRYRQAVLKAAFEGKLTQQWREKHKDIEPAEKILDKVKQELKKSNTKLESRSENGLLLGILPETWTWVTIGEIETFIGSGITPKGGRAVYVKEGVPFIRSQNVYPDGLHLEEIAHVTPEMHESMKRTKAYSNDVLLNITGASIGRSAVIPEMVQEANVNQHVCIIRTGWWMSPAYLSHFLNSPIGQTEIFGTQSGVTRQGLNYAQLRHLKIPMAPLAEQQEVVSQIEASYSLIKQVEKMLATNINYAEHLRQSILKDAFNGKLVPQDPADEPAERLLERIKAERLRNKSKNNQLELSKYVK